MAHRNCRGHFYEDLFDHTHSLYDVGHGSDHRGQTTRQVGRASCAPAISRQRYDPNPTKSTSECSYDTGVMILSMDAPEVRGVGESVLAMLRDKGASRSLRFRAWRARATC